ncbi:tyrosine-type recombinase/integrase [Actinomycetaceae bacterium MB13-C1-2]|nr:tyrosine-type recombinase/integrase [Actinomycetaceae bacterium MB13-C1-2]
MPAKESTPLPQRLMSSVQLTEGGCWEWQKVKNQTGYGQLWVGSRSDGTRKLRLAHVVAYETFRGAIPDGLVLDHLCENKACINPTHLEPVTSAQNFQRSREQRAPLPGVPTPQMKPSRRAVEPKKNHRLPYGEGSFYKRKDGMWVGTLEAGTNEKNKRRRIVVTSKDEDEAWDKLQVKRKILHLKGRAAALKGSRTVQAWVKDWLPIQQKRLRPNTFKGTRSYMTKWVIPQIGRVKLEDVDADHVRKVSRAVLDAGLSSTTAGTVQGVLQKCLRDARIEGYTVSDAALDVPKPRKENTRQRTAVPVDAAIALRTKAEQWPGGVRWLIAFVQGMRPAEVLGLTWNAIDFERGLMDVSWQLQALPYNTPRKRESGFSVPDGYEVKHLEDSWHLVRPKSDAGQRVMPLIPYVAKYLAAWRDSSERPENKGGLVFPRADGYPRSQREDREDWRALQDAAQQWKVPPVGDGKPKYWEAYEVRRATATMLLRDHVDPKIIKTIMGHSDVLVTEGYQDVDEKMLRDALEQVSQSLRPKQITA